MSEAIIAPITLSAHPDPEVHSLLIGTVCGYQVIVGKDTKEGELGIYFQEGLQLSEEFAAANNLIRKKCPETGKNIGGYFEESRRIRCQKFRKIKSEGFWIPLSSLAFTGYDVSKLSAGNRISKLNEIAICNKYYTPATRGARAKNKTSLRETTMFRAHFDTDQLRFNLHRFRNSPFTVVTHKLHGTSARTGYLKHPVKLMRSERFWNRIWNFLRLGDLYPLEEWRYVTGSRNVILDDGPYGFRFKAEQRFRDKLHKGETVFYEIVGYEGPGSPIMEPHKATDSEIKKKYTSAPIVYHYGCPDGEHDIYVYRITFTNEDGVTIDLPWEAVKHRCQEIGVKYTPEFAPLERRDGMELSEICGHDLEEPCPIGLTHPREGYCVRIEDVFGLKIFKHKAWTFGVLEGYIKDKPEYVDTEEAA